MPGIAAFGKHIRDLRLDSKRGLREAAREMGVSPSYLSRVESADDPPSGELMARLSACYKVSLESLTQLATSPTATAAAHGHQLKASPDLRALYRIGDLLQSEDLDVLLREALKKLALNKNCEYSEQEIEQQLSELKAELPRLNRQNDDLLAAQFKPRVLSKKRIWDIANEFLSHHGLTRQNYIPPTNIEYLVGLESDIDYRIEKLKCKSSGDPLVLGLTRWGEDGRKQILVNQALADSNTITDLARFNFTLGHELFHALEHLPCIAVGNPVLQRQFREVVLVERVHEPRSAAEKAVVAWSYSENHRRLLTAEDWREWQANTFASAVLMPPWAVEEEFWSRSGVAKIIAPEGENDKELALEIAGERIFGAVVYEKSLCEKFGVSRQAMAIRLLELNLVTREN